jgi:SNF2 family DNA or RNA helicase
VTTYEYRTQPMAHQVAGLRKIIANKGVAGLLFEPGTGKTKVVIDYAGMLAEASGRALVLVAAPLSALDTWTDEVALHLPERIEREVIILRGPIAARVEQLRALEPLEHGVTMVVTNLDAFAHSHRMPGTQTVTTRAAMIEAVRWAGFSLGVIDESHRVRGHSSNTSRAFAALSSSFPRRLILTGTVAPHSPMDFFGQWRFLNPDRFGTRWTDFRDRYAVTGGFRGKQIVAYRHLDELSQKIGQDALVVRKRDALDLPSVTDQVHHVELSPREAKAYQQMASTLVIEQEPGPDGQPIMASTKLVQWMRLRQLTSGHITHTGSDEITHFGSTKIDVTVDLCKDLVEAGEKVVVFAHFIDDVRRTAEAAQNALSAPVEAIWGATPTEERRRIRKTFLSHEGPMVIVAQMRTVSLAINEFVASSHAIFLSMSERRDDFEQARDRLDRKGQTRPVTFHHVVVRDSIDEVVLDSHRTKGNLEAAVLRYARSLADAAS